MIACQSFFCDFHVIARSWKK